jgi:flagellar biosynthesis/type III secretory pathway M-ring protein FliF/YscJ
MDALRRLLAQFRTFWGKLSTVRRVAAIAVLVAIVVSLGLASYLSQDSDYRPLFN